MLDKETSNLKKNYVHLFCQVTKICKETNKDINKNYQRGKKDAFEEILQWFNNSYNNEKVISVNSLIMFLQEKIDKTKLNLSSNNNSNSYEADIKPIFDLSDIKLKKDFDDEEEISFSSNNVNNWGYLKPDIFIPNNKRKKN